VNRSNDDVAGLLERVGNLLRAQHADPYRVRAYLRGAAICRKLDCPLATLLSEKGRRGLLELEGIGKSLAAAIEEIVLTGRLRMLDRIEGEVGPEELFTTLPGIGEEFSRRIHETLGIETLEELEVAAHDGRLARVSGLGARRVQAIRDEVATVLGQRSRRFAGPAPAERPAVKDLLAADAAYRRRAAEGSLPCLAPRRFNPTHAAWLPILHTRTPDGYQLTCMFSNSARAHRLGTTRDWVVIVHERDGLEGRCTVVTEQRGPLRGRRVVRSREAATEDQKLAASARR